MVFSDLDEIPSRKTVELLKECEFESPMHLGMRSFLYSFEWEEGGEAESWRPQAWVWEERGNGFEEYYRSVSISLSFGILTSPSLTLSHHYCTDMEK
jgi:beta-1,4-mannosyl-glycoprotein beta-1,4-N-acetylglucosaminyltransferase